MTRLTSSPHKYRAKPTEVDGIRFASQKEARRYQELKLLEQAGKIEELELQPRFPLYAAGTSGYVARALETATDRESLRIGEYRADFKYRDGRTVPYVVEDVKGFKTPLYRWKKKHVEAQYGITIREV